MPLSLDEHLLIPYLFHFLYYYSAIIIHRFCMNTYLYIHMYIKVHFYPQPIQFRAYCHASSVGASVHLSIHPAFITTLQTTIFNGSCSYLVQSLTLLGAWTLLITGFLCSFSRIQWHFHEYMLTGVWILICYHSTAENISWILFIFGAAIQLGMTCIDYEVSMMIL